MVNIDPHGLFCLYLLLNPSIIRAFFCLVADKSLLNGVAKTRKWSKSL